MAIKRLGQCEHLIGNHSSPCPSEAKGVCEFCSTCVCTAHFTSHDNGCEAVKHAQKILNEFSRLDENKPEWENGY